MALPHEVLGVAENADEAAINAAFRKAAKRYHPDLNNGDASGTRHLRRLIAARDFLTKHRRPFPIAQRVRRKLPPVRSFPGRRSLLFAGAITGAVCLLSVATLFALRGAGQPEVSAMKWAAQIEEGEPALPDAGLPDEDAAALKAIRDVREAISYPPYRMGMGLAPEPQFQSTVRRQRVTLPAREFRKAINEAASLMSKTFRNLASAQ